MKLWKFIRDINYEETYKKVDDPREVGCYAIRFFHKKVVAYPITSITVRSTPYISRVILNATYDLNKEPLSLEQLNFELTEIDRYLRDSDKRCSIFMSIKISKNSPVNYYTIPDWHKAFLRMDAEAYCIKVGCANSYLKNE